MVNWSFWFKPSNTGFALFSFRSASLPITRTRCPANLVARACASGNGGAVTLDKICDFCRMLKLIPPGTRSTSQVPPTRAERLPFTSALN
ncbi:hypothetical protein I7I50_10769 [Histoplasma capsulatum G186AR]|uniref:Uncharacterized protein n=1 Tax=Ajellomyces capsulatus TaxID=5037 RepID=A0A8H7ZA68_AJECA|nr:hypothetical protein I7I52_02008 [Histoplasma capsulatum]QSS69467.1 hypothetical protein I7I50_10769 [Histoplasma capsulatum G186AR]